jgi:hypothetical protein
LTKIIYNNNELERELINYRIQHRELILSKDIEIINKSQIKARCLVVPFSNEIIHDKKFIENDDYFYYHFITKSIRTSNFNISESKPVFNQDAYNPEILN